MHPIPSTEGKLVGNKMILKGLALVLLASLVVDLEALRIANPNRPGKCPRSRSLYRSSRFCGYIGGYSQATCRTDSQCSRFQKCCGCPRRCVDPVPEGPKPGECLALPLFIPPECDRIRVSRECNSDANCRGKDKCCSTQCGGTVCKPGFIATPPPPPKQNPLCPPPSFPPSCAAAFVVDQCQFDSECDPHKICCRGFCGAKQCVNKRFTPNPSCPITPTDPLPDFCAARASIPGCRVDSDCNRGRCCPDECGVPMCTRRSVY